MPKDSGRAGSVGIIASYEPTGSWPPEGLHNARGMKPAAWAEMQAWSSSKLKDSSSSSDVSMGAWQAAILACCSKETVQCRLIWSCTMAHAT